MGVLNSGLFRSFCISLPPWPEQRAIAAALGDADALIAALDGTIAKKRDLKQGAMQQLLAGRTRLLGFRGPWETRRFGELVLRRRTKGDVLKSQFCVELEHVEMGTGRLLGSCHAREPGLARSAFSDGDVVR
jgi:type I restriction enzyme S subunit